MTTSQPSTAQEFTVQARRSSQRVSCGSLKQPNSGSQLSLVQSTPSSQLSMPVGWQTPWLQVSPTVQALASLQLPPLLTIVQAVWESAGLQVRQPWFRGSVSPGA